MDRADSDGHDGPGGLVRVLRTRFAEALEAGALEPIETALHEIPDGGVRFAVRVVTGRPARRAFAARAASGAASQAGGDADPFQPPFEPALHVGDLGPDHVCLLNRYPVLRDHALVVTRRFAEQEAPLEPGDLRAVWTLLGETGGLAFYNAGRAAGASQRHRHFQWVPTPLSPDVACTPMDGLLEHTRFDTPLGRVPGLPFLHGVARLGSCRRMSSHEAALALHGMVGEMARAFGCHLPGRPYNLLLTRDWLLFVPRSRADWHGIPLNALAFAGTLLVRDREGLLRLRRAGPMAALRHAAVAAAPGSSL